MQSRVGNTMFKRKIATATVVMCLMGLARVATAQNSSDQFRPFNGLFANLFDDGSQPQQSQHQVQKNYNDNYNNNSTGTTQIHRVPTRAADSRSSTRTSPSPHRPAASNTNNATLPAPPAVSAARPRSPATGNNYSFQYDDGSSPVSPALDPPPPSTAVGGDAAISSTVAGGPDRFAAARATEGFPPVAVR